MQKKIPAHYLRSHHRHHEQIRLLEVHPCRKLQDAPEPGQEFIRPDHEQRVRGVEVRWQTPDVRLLHVGVFLVYAQLVQKHRPPATAQSLGQMPKPQEGHDYYKSNNFRPPSELCVVFLPVHNHLVVPVRHLWEREVDLAETHKWPDYDPDGQRGTAMKGQQQSQVFFEPTCTPTVRHEDVVLCRRKPMLLPARGRSHLLRRGPHLPEASQQGTNGHSPHTHLWL